MIYANKKYGYDVVSPKTTISIDCSDMSPFEIENILKAVDLVAPSADVEHHQEIGYRYKGDVFHTQEEMWMQWAGDNLPEDIGSVDQLNNLPSFEMVSSDKPNDETRGSETGRTQVTVSGLGDLVNCLIQRPYVHSIALPSWNRIQILEIAKAIREFAGLPEEDERRVV